MLALQAILMASAVLLVQLGGVAIDMIRFGRGQLEVAPPLPLGLRFPAEYSPLRQTLWLAAAMVVIAAARAALSYAYTLVSGTLVHHKIVVDLRADVYAKLQRLSLRFFSDQAAGTIINRVTGDVQAARTFVDGVLLQLSILLMSLIFYLGCMLQLHAGLTAACLATTPLVWWMSLRFSRAVRPLFDRARGLMDLLVLRVAENVDGVAVVKSTGRQELEIAAFDAANDEMLHHQAATFDHVAPFGPKIQFLTQVNLFVLLVYGGWLVSQNKLPLGSGLIVFAALLQQFSNQVGNLSGLAGTIQQSITGARRVFEVLEAAEGLEQPIDGYRPATIRGSIDMADVSFSYENEDAAVLSSICLHARPGEKIAILGGVGEGKTTLLCLVPRFFDPYGGVVRVDGVDVRQWDLPTLRRAVGFVMQEPILVSHTIAANIAFGRPDATEQQVRMAARIAAAHDFITAMPDGYLTVLGEYGMTLSGGQRQRLALARALLTDPPILLLDDPVSAVDPSTEAEILSAMRAAAAGRTTLIVANRLSTLRWADRVVVLDGGRIVQSGTHDELIEVEGVYRQVAHSQGYK